eukprot:737194-Hanusia_phi.AAC.1
MVIPEVQFARKGRGLLGPTTVWAPRLRRRETRRRAARGGSLAARRLDRDPDDADHYWQAEC